MSKSVKKRTAASTSANTAAKAAQLSQSERKSEQGKSGSKQSHVIAMLRSPPLISKSAWALHALGRRLFELDGRDKRAGLA
jgi:hypothetical protein